MKAMALEKLAPCTTAEPLRILLLENSPQDAQAILHELRYAGLAVEATLVADRSGFEEALDSGQFAAVLAVGGLPGWNGIEAVHFLRDSGKDLPFLLLTGSLGEEAAAEFIRQGFNDYVWRDQLTRLPGALKRTLEEKPIPGSADPLHQRLFGISPPCGLAVARFTVLAEALQPDLPG